MYKKEIAGATATSVNGGVATTYPGTTDYIKYGNGKTLTLTGQYEQFNTDYGYDVYCLATNGDWIIIEYNRDNTLHDVGYGWLLSDLNYYASKPANSSTLKNAQNMLNELVMINKRILENNLICRRLAKYMDAEDKQILNTLQANLEYRNSEIQNSGTVKDIRVASPNQLAQYGGDKYDINRIAIAGVATTMIVSAVVIAAVSAAAYYFYKGLLDEAKHDVKYSDELTAKLVAKLTPEEYEQLKRETAGMLTRESLKSRFSGGWTATKLLVIAALALFALPLLRDTKKRITKKSKDNGKD